MKSPQYVVAGTSAAVSKSETGPGRSGPRGNHWVWAPCLIMKSSEYDFQSMKFGFCDYYPTQCISTADYYLEFMCSKNE